jgi:hypothetical protein
VERLMPSHGGARVAGKCARSAKACGFAIATAEKCSESAEDATSRGSGSGLLTLLRHDVTELPDTGGTRV